jgi:hypothetical protein
VRAHSLQGRRWQCQCCRWRWHRQDYCVDHGRIAGSDGSTDYAPQPIYDRADGAADSTDAQRIDDHDHIGTYGNHDHDDNHIGAGVDHDYHGRSRDDHHYTGANGRTNERAYAFDADAAAMRLDVHGRPVRAALDHRHVLPPLPGREIHVRHARECVLELQQGRVQRCGCFTVHKVRCWSLRK